MLCAGSSQVALFDRAGRRNRRAVLGTAPRWLDIGSDASDRIQCIYMHRARRVRLENIWLFHGKRACDPWACVHPLLVRGAVLRQEPKVSRDIWTGSVLLFHYTTSTLQPTASRSSRAFEFIAAYAFEHRSLASSAMAESIAPHRGSPPPADGMAAVRIAFPQTPEDFENDPRVSFSRLDDKWILEEDDGSEWEWSDRSAKWLPAVGTSTLPRPD